MGTTNQTLQQQQQLLKISPVNLVVILISNASLISAT